MHTEPPITPKLAYKKYYLFDSVTRAVLAIFAAGEILGAFAAIRSGDVLLSLLFLVMSAAFLLVAQSRLVTSSEGIKYRSGFSSLSTIWDDIEGIERLNWFPGLPSECLRLSRLAHRHGFGFLAALPLSGATRNIPLPTWRWRDSEFGHTLAEHVPHLLAATPETLQKTR